MSGDNDLARIKNVENGNKQAYMDIMNPLYEKDRLGPYTLDLMGNIAGLESFIPGYVFDFNIEKDQENLGNSEEELIKRIISMARYEFEREYFINSRENPMISKCRDMSEILERICNRLNIKCYKFDFNNPVMQHRAVVICLGSGNHYLIDLTYQQFFLLGNNLPNRHVTKRFPGNEIVVEGPYIGNHIIDEGREEEARVILEKGYTPIDDLVFKIYTDGFFNSFYNQSKRERYLMLSTGQIMDIIRKRGYIGKYER